MPSQAIIDICNLLGIKLADRDAAVSWIYDGSSIALWYTENMWFDGGPRRRKEFTDHDLLHEIGHWLACTEPVQRELPEYGLSFAPHESVPMGEFRLANGDIHPRAGFYDGLVPNMQQIQEEYLAQQLAIGLGVLFGLSPELGEKSTQVIDSSWEQYYEFKQDEWVTY